eukprot:jgi/Mesen1/4935/ME000246S04157
MSAMSRKGDGNASPWYELAKKLSKPPAQKDVLLKTLKEAASQLQEVQQSASVAVSGPIKPIAYALIQPQILEHTNKDVRVLAAACLSDILRIFAPDAPIPDNVLKEVFKLFVAVFHGLDESSSPSFHRRVGILETLAKYKTCIVMLDLECDALIQEMFERFFTIVREEHPYTLKSAMLEVMASIIDESEENGPSPALVEEILKNLLPKRREESPAASDLAVALVQRTKNQLQHPVQAYLGSIMANRGRPESELQSDYHNVIYELYKASPEMLVAVLPNFQQELVENNVDTRLRAIELLGRLFSLPGQQAARQYKLLFSEFCKRLVDKSTDVRVKMAELVPQCLINLPDQEANELICTSLWRSTTKLGERVLDPDDKMRMGVVKAFCSLARSHPKLVPVEYLKSVSERVRDKKASLRKSTLFELASVYREHCKRCWEGTEALDEQQQQQYEWIPGLLINCCFDKDVKEFKFQVVEGVLEETLFPPKLPIENKARHWMAFFSCFGANEVKALGFIFNVKHKIQSAMAGYLDVRQKLKEEPDSEELQVEMQRCFGIICVAFGKPKAEEHLNKLHQMKDNHIFRAFSTLLNPDTTFAQARSVREDLLKRVGEKHAQYEFVKELATKTTFTLFGKEHVVAILKLVKSRELQRSSEHLVSAGLKLLAEVADKFPELLQNSEGEILELLRGDVDCLKSGAVEILPKIGSRLQGTPGAATISSAGELEDTLMEMAVRGTRDQAKHAVKALAATGDAGIRCLTRLYQKLVGCLEDTSMLPTVLQSLGTIAQHAMAVFEAQEDDIIKFVVRNILRRHPEPTIRRKFEWDHPSAECRLKMYGIKALVKSFLPAKRSENVNGVRPKIRGLLNVLGKLVPVGELIDDVQSSEVDRGHMRLAAAKAVLRLARRWDSSIPPITFHLTAMTAQDACVDVRRLFVAKVAKYLKDHSLPYKYACVFALSAVDANKDSVNEAKKNLVDFVELARKEAVTKQAQQQQQQEVMTIQWHPEYVLVYLVHVLAHHPDFPMDQAAQADPKRYEPFTAQLQMYLKALLQQHSHHGGGGGDDAPRMELRSDDDSDNVPAILAILRAVKNTDDAVEFSKTQNLYALCDMGLAITRELSKKKLHAGEFPTDIPLPTTFFRPLVRAGEDPTSALEPDGTHMPKCLLGLDDAKLAGAPSKHKALSLPATRQPSASAAAAAATTPAPAAAAAGASRGKKRGKGGKEGAAEEEKEAAAAGQLVVTSSSAADTGSVQKRARKDGEATAAAAAADDDDAGLEAPVRDVLRSDAKRTHDSSSAKKATAAAAGGSSEKKGRKKHAPAAPSLSLQTPDVKEKGKAREFGEELVECELRVWWPMDKKFYTGKVIAFDAKTRKHQVVYADGDKEHLRMSSQRWELLDTAKAASLGLLTPPPAPPPCSPAATPQSKDAGGEAATGTGPGPGTGDNKRRGRSSRLKVAEHSSAAPSSPQPVVAAAGTKVTLEASKGGGKPSSTNLSGKGKSKRKNAGGEDVLQEEGLKDGGTAKEKEDKTSPMLEEKTIGAQNGKAESEEAGGIASEWEMQDLPEEVVEADKLKQALSTQDVPQEGKEAQSRNTRQRGIKHKGGGAEQSESAVAAEATSDSAPVPSDKDSLERDHDDNE